MSHLIHMQILWSFLFFSVCVQPLTTQFEESMARRGEEIKNIKLAMNNVEDEIFQDFCQQIGVENIRYVTKLVCIKK